MTQRVALVTGGTGAIGLESCVAIGRQGHKVVTTCLEAERAAADAFRERMVREDIDHGVVFGDVSDWDQCGALIEETENRFGPVGILVNCAGVTEDTFLHRMDKDAWDRVIRINLYSVFNMCRQIIGGMRERGWGRIVNISSQNGQTGQIGQCNYSASKAGMHGFTMALARETARKGITVNTVSPGYIESRLTLAIDETIREGIVGTIPAGRMGRPEEIGNVVGFLASDQASYITGANIPVNGGAFMSF